MLSDKPNIQSLKSPLKRKPTDPEKTWYSDAQKIEAVKCWLITGNYTQTAAALQMPVDTLRKWYSQNWWKELVRELRTESNLKLSARLKGIADKALVATEDRLENGDWIYDQKTGEMRRKPVSIRDVHRIALDFTGKAIELEKMPVVEENNKQVMDRLESLKATFERFAGKQKAVIVTDVVFGEEDHAVHDQRETGLQPGESVGSQPQVWETVEGSGSEESSSLPDDEIR